MELSSLSPNQLAKRADIVEAAKHVLETGGLDAFTTRSLTEHGSFSRSAIHYYFGSVEEIVEAAMTSRLEEFLAHLTEVAAAHDDPRDRFWAVTDGYLEFLTERPALTLLWFDYAIAGVQAGRPEPAVEIETQIRARMSELLRAADVPDVEARSEALVAFMLGTTLRGVLHPGSTVGDLRRQLALLSGLD